MPYVVSMKSGQAFDTIPEGVVQAVCVDVIDLGEKTTQYGPKYQYKFVFETAHQNHDGKPLLAFTWPYTASLSEKANLRKMLETWRGRSFTEEELAGFDLEAVIGASATLMIVHKTTAKGTYANIGGIFKGDSKHAYSSCSDYVRVKDRTQEEPKTQQPQEEEDDEVPF